MLLATPVRLNLLSNGRSRGLLSYGNSSNKNVQLVSQHCCKTSRKAMLRVLHPTHSLSRNEKKICCKLLQGVAESRGPFYFLNKIPKMLPVLPLQGNLFRN